MCPNELFRSLYTLNMGHDDLNTQKHIYLFVKMIELIVIVITSDHLYINHNKINVFFSFFF